MTIEIVGFPINSMVDLSIAMLVYQRVSYTHCSDSQYRMDDHSPFIPCRLTLAGPNCPDQCPPGSPLCITGLGGHRRLAEKNIWKTQHFSIGKNWENIWKHTWKNMEYGTHPSFFLERYGEHMGIMVNQRSS